MSRKRIFQVADPQGRPVVFYDDTWEHIKSEHPEIRDYYRIKATVMSPSLILEVPLRQSLAYIDTTQLSLYFNVFTKFDEAFEEGIVRSAYLTRKLIVGDVIWTASTTKSPKSKK